MRASLFWIAGIALAAGACASAPSRPAVEFPGPEKLAEIERKPAAPPKVTEGAVPEGGWTIEVPASLSTADAWTPSTAWDTAVAEQLAASGKRPRLTRAMSCVAREVGRYFLQAGKAPPLSLRRFMLGACGSLATEVGLLPLAGEVPTAVSDDEILARWKAQVAKDVVGGLPAAATEAGFAFQRQQGGATGKVVALLAYARARAEFQPLVPVPGDAGQVTITGQITDQAQYIAAYANQGRFGVIPCYVDPTVARPRFSITCSIDPEDESARIDLVYAQPRRVLAIPFAHVLVRKPEATRLVYQDTTPAAGRPITDAGQFAPAALAALNEVRGQAGLKPVRLANAQSAAAARVAGHFFSAATAGEDPEQIDTIALALLAGWQVAGGMIRDATFAATLVPGTRDVGRWLATTLEMPLSRSALLADQIEEVAFGPVALDEPEALGAMVMGYSFHHGSDHTGDVRRLLTRAVLARRQRKLADPQRLGLDAVMKEQLQLVHAGKATAEEALNTLLQAGVGSFNQNMRGYVLETTSLDALEIPAEVLTQNTLHLEIGVTHHRPPGAAWGQLVILVIYVDYGDQQST